MTVKINDIAKFIEREFADIHKQSKWDNSGLQIYLGEEIKVSRLLLSLDITEDVIEEAIHTGCELILTHHPLFFSKITSIDVNTAIGRKVVKAIKNNISILSYHTNIDVADDCINSCIAHKLSAKVIKKPLTIEGEVERYKFSVSTPTTSSDKVFKAVTDANRSKMGNYSNVASLTNITGRFTPDEKANPTIGKQLQPVEVDEVKLECIVDKRYMNDVIEAVKTSHPYEEPAYDFIKLDSGLSYGFGLIAELDKTYSLQDFIDYLKDRLHIKNISSNMKEIEPFSKIAISSGSSASSFKDCLKHGVKVLLTGDLKHHDALDAREAGICIIDITHQYSESIYLDRLAEVLKDKFKVDVLIKSEIESIISWR